MTSVKKVVLNGDSEFLSTIEKMRKKGYTAIQFFLSGSKRHSKDGLEPNQILVLGYRYHSRPDVSERKVQIIMPSPKHTYYLCSCGTEFDAYEKWVSHIRGTSHYLKDEITR